MRNRDENYGFEKLVPASESPLDGRVPAMSISSKMYEKGLARLRAQAKREHKKLLTEKGLEDYTQ